MAYSTNQAKGFIGAASTLRPAPYRILGWCI